MIPNGAIGARFSPDGATMYLTDATGLGIYDVSSPGSPQIRSHVPLPRREAAGVLHLVDVADPAAPVIRETRHWAGALTVYDVRDLSRPPVAATAPAEELAWVSGERATFAFDVTDPCRPRPVLGGPGEPSPGHRALLGALTWRPQAWPGHGVPVGFYVTTEHFWGAYLAPRDCPPLGSWGRVTERADSLSPIGEWGRSASWGRGPVPSPTAHLSTSRPRPSSSSSVAVASDARNHPSPVGPKVVPGATATPRRRSTSSAHAVTSPPLRSRTSIQR